VGGGVGEEVAYLFAETDLPWCAGGDLFSGDEPVAEPAVQGGGGETELVGGVGDGEEFAFCGLVVFGGVVAGYLPVVAESLDSAAGEGQSSGAATSLAVEDPGDSGVGVVQGETAYQLDGVFVGADFRWAAFDGHVEVGGGFAFPAQYQSALAAGLVAFDGDVDLVEEGVEQLFAVFVGRGGRVPYRVEVPAEVGDGGAFVAGEGFGADRFLAGEVVLCRGQGGQGVFPVGFETSGDEAVIGVDGEVAAFGCLVAGDFDLASPLSGVPPVLLSPSLCCLR